MSKIDLIVQLHKQLVDRLDYTFIYGEISSCGPDESCREYDRLHKGHKLLEVKLGALILEMKEFLYLGGEIK